MEHSYAVLAKLLDNRYRWVHHLLFISLIFLFWFLFLFNSYKPEKNYFNTSLFSCTYVIIAYFNIYVLFQRYLLKSKILMYCTISLLTFMLSYLVQGFIYFKSWEQFKKDFTPAVPLLADFMINIITYYMFIGIGLSVKTIKLWLNSEMKIVSLEQESLKSRLNSLRSQVSPHFLFNTFNNLYVLTKTNPAVASEMVLGFADLMRYQLTESENDKVNIEKEIEYIGNFLSLEKLRKDNIDIRFDYDKNELKGILIEPLLFVTFIENAVKHGSQQLDNPYIHVSITCRQNKLSFEVINSKPEVSILGKEKSLGKGLENLKKRLELLYVGKHTIELQNNKTTYLAKLNIELL